MQTALGHVGAGYVALQGDVYFDPVLKIEGAENQTFENWSGKFQSINYVSGRYKVFIIVLSELFHGNCLHFKAHAE
jgi:hypothetical protein